MKIACTRCGADVIFLPREQKCYCDYCGSIIDFSEFKTEDVEKIINETTDTNEIYSEFNCSTCGAKLVTDSNTIVTKCLFCGSQQIIKERLSGKFEPQELIPFKIDKETFINMYSDFLKKRWLAPNTFRNNPNINETRGLYVPFYIYDMNEKVAATGTASKRQNKNNLYKHFELEFKDKITSPQDASKNLDDDIMTSLEPFDLNELKEFSPPYITGFLCENGDEELEDLRQKAEYRAFSIVKSKVNSKIKNGYSFSDGEVCIDFEDTTCKYVFLPVWFFNSWYKDKKFSYAINGQTGKIVGRIPLSKPKFYSFMAILTIVAIVLSVVLPVDSDNGPILQILVWIIYVSIFLGIKAKYTNVKKVKENPVISSEPYDIVYSDYASLLKSETGFFNEIKYKKSRAGIFDENFEFDD